MKLKKAIQLGNACIKSPLAIAYLLRKLPARLMAQKFAAKYQDQRSENLKIGAAPSNPFKDYCINHTEGHGIWKWHHYFDIYHRHFAKFIGQKVNILEIGIYSGGSLGMWRSYFGPKSHIFGVDIEEACKCYENEYTSVFIGDQGARDFWSEFRKNASPIDILIDDGGHHPEQQRITMEEMLPYLSPGGVYVCEDIHGKWNDFAAYVTSFVDELNHFGELNPFQKSVHSMHFYPFSVVIEKHLIRPETLVAPKHGTQWQPFYEK
jgi:hypothetical protein